MKRYFRLNYEISPWLPKYSVWYREDNGEWGGQTKLHGLGNASDDYPYWFTLLLEQEMKNPSGGDHNQPIITEVEEKIAWVEKDNIEIIED